MRKQRKGPEVGEGMWCKTRLKKACVVGVERMRGSRVVPSEAGDIGRDQTCIILHYIVSIGRLFFILRL